MLAFTFLLVARSVLGVEVPEPLREVGVNERLGSVIDFSQYTVVDEAGSERRLSDFVGGAKKKPVVFQLVYFGCPMMCGLVFAGDQKLIREMPWLPSEAYELVSLSIHPKEDATLARQKKANLIAGLPEAVREKAQAGWHFLTAREDTSIALGAALGISFKYDTRAKEYAHPAASIVISPEGKITRYLYGFEHRAQDAKLALLEATAGKIGTVADRILMFCYRYDPAGRTYSLVAMRLVQAGSTVTVLALGGFYFGVFRRERRRKQRSSREGVRL